MKFLKGLGLTVLGFLLFLSLSIFTMAFLLNSTILNPDFITSELDRFEVSSLAEEIISGQTPEELPEEFNAALVDTITKLEPVVKEQVNAAIYSVYDYLLGERKSPELAHTLRNTFLSSDFIISIVDELDMSTLAKDIISEQLAGEIPEELGFVTEAIDDTLVELEPWLKEQIRDAADPIADYLLGKSQGLSVVISTEPLVSSLKDNLLQVLLESPPPEFANLPPAMIEQQFDTFFQEFAGMIPATFEIDESLVGTEMPAEIAAALAEAEGVLEQVREVISYYQLGYNLLIVFMLLLIAGIILIHRQVRGATRSLGIIFLTYSIPLLIGIFVAKYFAPAQLTQLPPLPPLLEAWLPQFLDNLLAPIQMLGIGLVAGGVALLVVSFVYKQSQQQSEP